MVIPRNIRCSRCDKVIGEPPFPRTCPPPDTPKVETDVLDKDGKVIPGMKWVTVKGAKAGETLPEFTGRVFRD